MISRYLGRSRKASLGAFRMKNYCGTTLFVRGFVPAAAQTVLLAYRETFCNLWSAAWENRYDSGPTAAPETQMVHPATHVNQEFVP